MLVKEGTGKLYGPGGKQVEKAVKYRIWQKPQTEFTLGEWSGELTLTRVIPLGEYVIELDDGCKGNIIIVSIGNSRSQPGHPIYDYPFQGSGTLE